MPSTDLTTLLDARKKAAALLTEIERQHREIEAKPPDLPPAQLAAGREAMDKALAAARRMVTNLDQAIEMAREWN